MRNFQDTFETCNRWFISAFLVCKTVTLSSFYIVDIVVYNNLISFPKRRGKGCWSGNLYNCTWYVALGKVDVKIKQCFPQIVT